MSKHIDADAFVKLYKRVNKGVGVDHIISLINAMPDVSDTPEETTHTAKAEENESEKESIPKKPENISEEEREEIESLLKSLYHELVAQPAWMAHCYGFENMEEYVEKLVPFMKAHNIPTENLRLSYQDAEEEYEKIAQSEILSFMIYEDTEDLEKKTKNFCMNSKNRRRKWQILLTSKTNGLPSLSRNLTYVDLYTDTTRTIIPHGM